MSQAVEKVNQTNISRFFFGRVVCNFLVELLFVDWMTWMLVLFVESHPASFLVAKSCHVTLNLLEHMASHMALDGRFEFSLL